MLTAAGEKSAGEMRLFASNGARSGMLRPPLHAGDVIAVKSPASICAVGTKAKNVLGWTSTRVPW
jgi:hypothetical protein